MTRATLLRLLAHPTALNGADVRALEELAEAFPYCQTAHLLLAKAAHDHGSMLAGQRLRRAATYATDRALLRQLLEATPLEAALELAAAQPVASQPIVALEYFTELPTNPAEASSAAPPHLLLTDQPAQNIGPAPQAEAATEAPETPAAADNENALLPEAAVSAAEATAAAEASSAEAVASSAVADDEAAALAEAPTPADADTQDETHLDANVAPLGSEQLPAQAPPTRLPAEAAANQDEFGLAAEEPAEVAAYQLPELELDITVPLAPAVATPRLPAFSGVPDVAYAPYAGSRYGYGLVAVAEAGELPVPAAGLPPAGEFFLPDALLLAHLAAPPELPTSSTTDLINSFLRRAPAGPRRRAAPAASPQDDLSVRSTRAAPDLTSESLAKILARQGKVEQAIAVYERLMVKMPEKSAIFAAEIEALRPSA